MIKTDVKAFSDAFAAQGWNKKTATLEKYYREQYEGRRKVLVCEYEGEVAGYLTLLPDAPEGPFKGMNIPEVVDFNVLKKFRGNGLGWALMDAVEALAKKTSDEICLGVGLYTDYGTAQRMYVKRGYIPDGSGIWYGGDAPLEPGAPCVNDDDLVLYLSKKL